MAQTLPETFTVSLNSRTLPAEYQTVVLKLGQAGSCLEGNTLFLLDYGIKQYVKDKLTKVSTLREQLAVLSDTLARIGSVPLEIRANAAEAADPIRAMVLGDKTFRATLEKRVAEKGFKKPGGKATEEERATYAEVFERVLEAFLAANKDRLEAEYRRRQEAVEDFA